MRSGVFPKAMPITPAAGAASSAISARDALASGRSGPRRDGTSGKSRCGRGVFGSMPFGMIAIGGGTWITFTTTPSGMGIAARRRIGRGVPLNDGCERAGTRRTGAQWFRMSSRVWNASEMPVGRVAACFSWFGGGSGGGVIVARFRSFGGLLRPTYGSFSTGDAVIPAAVLPDLPGCQSRAKTFSKSMRAWQGPRSNVMVWSPVSARFW